MKRGAPSRLIVPAVLVLAAGQAVSVRAQEAQPPATPPAPESPAPSQPPSPQPELQPAPAAAQPPAAQPAAPPPAVAPAEPRLRFTFKDAPYEQVLDFLARQTGLPVIREADLPNAPVTF